MINITIKLVEKWLGACLAIMELSTALMIRHQYDFIEKQFPQ